MRGLDLLPGSVVRFRATTKCRIWAGIKLSFQPEAMPIFEGT